MAKVPKTKKREVSIHSRAARRHDAAAADGIRAKPVTSEQNEHWLYNTQNAGVSKKTKVKKLTHAQRVRQSKAAERAERNMDVLEKKVAESKHKGRKVQARRKDWDDLNGTMAAAAVATPKSGVAEPDTGAAMDGVEADTVTTEIEDLDEGIEVRQADDTSMAVHADGTEIRPAEDVDIIT